MARAAWNPSELIYPPCHAITLHANCCTQHIISLHANGKKICCCISMCMLAQTSFVTQHISGKASWLCFAGSGLIQHQRPGQGVQRSRCVACWTEEVLVWSSYIQISSATKAFAVQAAILVKIHNDAAPITECPSILAGVCIKGPSDTTKFTGYKNCGKGANCNQEGIAEYIIRIPWTTFFHGTRRSIPPHILQDSFELDLWEIRTVVQEQYQVPPISPPSGCPTKYTHSFDSLLLDFKGCVKISSGLIKP